MFAGLVAALALWQVTTSRSFLVGVGNVRMTQSASWDLDAAVADKPLGTYHRVADPIAHTVRLSYTATQGIDRHEDEVNATIPEERAGGGSWQRLSEAERDPLEGLKAVVLYDIAAQRAIIGFRGLNLSPLPGDSNRDADICAALALGLEEATSQAAADCSRFSPETIDYFAQAVSVVQQTTLLLPGFSVLLTGHSLGASLAVLVAAKLGGGLKAFTFGLGDLSKALTTRLGFGTDDFEGLAAMVGPVRFVGVENPCDPTYLHVVTSTGSQIGATICVNTNATVVPGCHACAAAGGDLSKPSCGICFERAHAFRAYLDVVEIPSEVPTCAPSDTSLRVTQQVLAGRAMQPFDLLRKRWLSPRS